MPDGLSEQNQVHVMSPDLYLNMTYDSGWHVNQRCALEGDKFNPEMNFLFIHSPSKQM